MVSRPVVQQLPPPESRQLTAALERLGRDPRDVDALIDAGNAAMGMEDLDAAIGFFRRAEQVSPSDARVKAGLASATVRSGDPFDAIPLFDAAEQAGAQVSAIAGDRGLAYDLVGDNVAAQRYYRMALARGPSDAITRRLAISQAIAGDKAGAEATLLPLLRKQDKSAWRARTFVLAISGNVEEAVKVSNSLLPPQLAESIAPYLRYMPRLTRAQQAAAANLGAFPRAAEIGHDDPRVAQFAPSTAKATSVAALENGLVPKGEPLGSRRAKSRAKKSEGELPPVAANGRVLPQQPISRATPPPEPQPARETSAPEPGELEPVATQKVQQASAVPASAARPAIAQAAPAATPAAAPAARATASQPPALAQTRASTPAPGFDLASMPRQSAAAQPAPAVAAAPAATLAVATPTAAASPAAASPAAAAPAAAPPPAAPSPAQEEQLSLAEAFRDLGKPDVTAAPIAGAVDLRKIKPAVPEPPKPPPPSHPSRIWVQLGVGRNTSAMPWDWKRLSREAPEAFKGKKASVSAMGQTNRLLAGPFESEKAADEFLAQLHRAGINGPLIWTSPAGQVVDALAGT